MPTATFHDTNEIVVAATLWLMHRYQQTGCNKLARLVEQHLRWIETRATSPQLAAVCQRLTVEWHSASCTPSSNTAIH